jgi:hypothetical protein
VSRGNPWARHYQAVWHERVAHRNLPNWLRVAALAYGSHAANGHAVFKPGDIGIVLGTPGCPIDKNNVQRAIRTAIENGWLSPLSGSTCLVVPMHAVAGGMGSPNQPCPVHSRPSKVGHSLTYPPAEGGSLSDPLVGHSMPTLKSVTSTNVAALYESSTHLSDEEAS